LAAKYRKIDPRFWDDEKVMALDTANTLIAAYCFSNKETNRVGLYPFSVGLASELTKIPRADFVRRFVSVRNKLGWPFDLATRVLYLPTWWKYNPPENPSHFVGCLSDLHDLPSCHLLGDFLKNDIYLFNDYKDLLKRRAPLFETRVPTRVPHSGGEQEQEQITEAESESITLLPPSPPLNFKPSANSESWLSEPWPSVRRFVAEHNTKTPDWWPHTKTISDGLTDKVKAYLKQFPDFEWWAVVFSNIHRANAWMRAYHNKGLGWLLQRGKNDGIENCAKVHDGKYLQ
jgi:hypothetical protein